MLKLVAALWAAVVACTVTPTSISPQSSNPVTAQSTVETVVVWGKTKADAVVKLISGPVGILGIAKHQAEQGLPQLLLFLTLLSANLAVMNMLPIPVLDGGHMVFLAYEGLFRRPPNLKVQVALQYTGLLLLLGLMGFALLLDLSIINRF